jgi:hypothetical protein
MLIEIAHILIIIISIIWTIAIIFMFISSHKIIPWNKYKGRLPGQICLIIVHCILLTLIWLQNFEYHLSVKIFMLFWAIAGIFFLLWFMGFRIVERNDLERQFRERTKTLEKLKKRIKKTQENIEKIQKELKE